MKEYQHKMGDFHPHVWSKSNINIAHARATRALNTNAIAIGHSKLFLSKL